jgi:hypothetical protein
MPRSGHILALFLAPAFACSSPSSPPTGEQTAPGTRWVRVVGMVDSAGVAPGPLIVPDPVQARVSFEVTIATYGGSGCIHPAQSQVQQDVSSATITPYDSLAINPPCPPDWHRYARTLQLRFDAPGSATVSLQGRGFGSQLLTLPRTITVLP